MNNELLTIYVGIIAGCMVLITLMVAVIGLQAFKTMNRMYAFLDNIQHEFSFLFTKASLTMHELNVLIEHLKVETSSLGAKSFLTLHELQEMISYIHIETKSLAYQASSGIAKITLGSLAIDTLFKFFLKNKNK